MNKQFNLFLVFMASLALFSCSSDDNSPVSDNFVVAFQSPSLQLTELGEAVSVGLTFSKPAPANGSVQLQFTPTNMVYGEDFATFPESTDLEMSLPIEEGTTSVSFTFEQLLPVLEGEEKSIQIQITEVLVANGITSGTTSMLINFEESASLGGAFDVGVGGPNQPNQVFVSLRQNRAQTSRRDVWDIALSNASTPRLILNYSLQMAATSLQVTSFEDVDMQEVQNLQNQVVIGTFDASNMQYIDHPSGNLNQTVFGNIAATENDAAVFLVNLGNEVATEPAQTGFANVSGDPRGWALVKVFAQGNNYTIQHKSLDENQVNEVNIAKDNTFSFQYLSLNSGSLVNVAPPTTEWDLNFTVFTDEIPNFGSYMYTDYVLTNMHGGVKAYMLTNEVFTYQDFVIADVDESLFAEDQRSIGSSWRSGGGPGQAPSLREDRFYIIKDAEENLYKLRFTALLNEIGERGFPGFEYQLLQ